MEYFCIVYGYKYTLFLFDSEIKATYRSVTDHYGSSHLTTVELRLAEKILGCFGVVLQVSVIHVTTHEKYCRIIALGVGLRINFADRVHHDLCYFIYHFRLWYRFVIRRIGSNNEKVIDF